MSNEVYIYDNTEVVMTGRTAVRNPKAKARRTGTRSPEKRDTLYEVKPADPEEGSWTRWVRMSDLYEIIDNNKADNNDNKIPRQTIPEPDDTDTE